MAQPVSRRPRNKRYLGNSSPSKKEVHDLQNEKPQCQVDQIISAGNAVVFTPDSLSKAHAEGYDNGHWCLGRSTR